MILATLEEGARGFDANQPIDATTANAFVRHGYRFAVRYVRRDHANAHDLSAGELADLLAAGIGVMCVQHVESETAWTPTAAKGSAYGAAAADELSRLGCPVGSLVWCDLEGVSTDTPADDVVAYLRAWHAAVSAAGFLPGLYVGWRAGLDADTLYHSIPFSRYWAAYNLNADQAPAVRGVCMKQHLRAPGDTPIGVAVDFDVNVVRRDGKGDLPSMIVADTLA